MDSSHSFNATRPANLDSPLPKIDEYSQLSFLSGVERSVTVTPQNFRFDGRLLASSWYAPFAAMILYHLIIQLVPRFTTRERRCKSFEVLHNCLLTVLSLATSVGMLQAVFQRATEDGWFGVICPMRPFVSTHDGPIGYWTYIFYLTKYYELVDTVILAFRKKPVIFLHSYHHTIMVIGTYLWLRYPWMLGAWYCVFVNSVVHTFMYTYYAISVIQSKPPSWGRYLTQGQIIQFMSGICVLILWIYLQYTYRCVSHWIPGLVSSAINISFLALFVMFYLKKEKRVRKPADGAKGDGAKEPSPTSKRAASVPAPTEQ